MKANVTNKLNKTMNASVLRMQQIYRHQLVVCLCQIRFQRTPAFFVLFCAFVVQQHCLQRKNRGMCENEIVFYIIMWKKLRYLCI